VAGWGAHPADIGRFWLFLTIAQRLDIADDTMMALHPSPCAFKLVKHYFWQPTVFVWPPETTRVHKVCRTMVSCGGFANQLFCTIPQSLLGRPVLHLVMPEQDLFHTLLLRWQWAHLLPASHHLQTRRPKNQDLHLRVDRSLVLPTTLRP